MSVFNLDTFDCRAPRASQYHHPGIALSDGDLEAQYILPFDIGTGRNNGHAIFAPETRSCFVKDADDRRCAPDAMSRLELFAASHEGLHPVGGDHLIGFLETGCAMSRQRDNPNVETPARGTIR